MGVLREEPRAGGREGAPFIARHLIEPTDVAFDDFAGGGSDAERTARSWVWPRNGDDVMESWKRKLRMGMVGGGQGRLHRRRFTASPPRSISRSSSSPAVSRRSYDNTKLTGAQLYLDPARCYRDLRGHGGSGSEAACRQADRFCQHRHAQRLAFPDRQDISRCWFSRRLRQADDLQRSARPRSWSSWWRRRASSSP